MAQTVVLLDGETGGFIVEENSVKQIPKISEDLRLHLTAVNALVKALEAGDGLDPGRADLEALVVQAANLALRRLERSVGIETALPSAVETQQLAEPIESAVAAPEIEGIAETAVVVTPDETPVESVMVEATPVVPVEAAVEAEVAEAAPIESEAETEPEAASIGTTEPEVEAVTVVSMEPVMIEAAPAAAIEPVAVMSMEPVAVEAESIAAESVSAEIESVAQVEAVTEVASEIPVETESVVEAARAGQVETEVNQTAPTEVDEPIEAESDTAEPAIAEAAPAATLEPVSAEPVRVEAVSAEAISAEPEVAEPVTNGASTAPVAEANEPEVQVEATAPLTLPEASESMMAASEKKIEEDTDTNPQQLEPIHAQIIESVQASAEASS
jgi:hypothetical protein